MKSREQEKDVFASLFGISPPELKKDIKNITELMLYVFCQLHKKYGAGKFRLCKFGGYYYYYAGFMVKKEEGVRSPDQWIACTHEKSAQSCDLHYGICRSRTDGKLESVITVSSGYYNDSATRQPHPFSGTKPEIRTSIWGIENAPIDSPYILQYQKFAGLIRKEFIAVSSLVSTFPVPESSLVSLYD